MARNWEAGHVIMGRYRLMSLLGQGGMGSVWKAEHIELKNQVAIKLLDAAIAQNEEMIARFLREARAAASLQNRHVIQIFDHGIEDGDAFMVMELLHGETLGERLTRKGILPVEETVKFMVQVMRAMGKAHDTGIIHRDLKPDNIFITSDDEGEYAKVLDFGVAKVGGDLNATNGVKTQTGMMLGTPFYMSPEQAKAKKVDARTDVWALAVITYECLTGKRPFTGDSFADLVLTLCNAPIPIPSRIASVPVGFDEWFVHATQRDVDRRFRSARDMANELIHLAAAPMTGTAQAGPGYVGSLGPVKTPARGTPGQARMSLTTGQSAAVGIDTRRNQIPQSRSGAPWVLIGAAVMLSAVGGGLFAWKSTRQAASAAAEPVIVQQDTVMPAPEADSAVSPEKAPEAQAKPSEPDATDANAAAATQPTQPAPDQAAAEAPSDTRPAAAQPSTVARPATTRPAPAPQPATQPTPEAPKPATNSVPVVDKQALPPEEWEF